MTIRTPKLMKNLTMKNNFYIYIHVSLNGKTFYVGKGFGDRAWRKNNRNKDWHRIANEGYAIFIIANNLSELDAFNAEIKMISAIGRRNLVNKTDGGDGLSGYIPTFEARSKMSAAQRGRKHSETTKRKIAAAHIGMKASNETKRKLSEKAKNRKASDETKEILSNKLIGNDRRRNKNIYIFQHEILGTIETDMKTFQSITGDIQQN